MEADTIGQLAKLYPATFFLAGPEPPAVEDRHRVIAPAHEQFQEHNTSERLTTFAGRGVRGRG